jgi:hypothetical protein
MSRMRNHITRLPADVRGRISMLLDDGATYQEVREDAVVAEACSSRGLTLHDTTFAAWLKGDEHQGYVEARRRYGQEIERRKLAAYVVDNSRGADDLARIATFEVLRRVTERLEHGDELDSKELRSLSTALAAYERNRIAEATAEARREGERELQRYQHRIEELEAEVVRLSSAGGGIGGLSDEQVGEIKRRLGL